MERARKKALAARKHHLKKQHRMPLETYLDIKVFQGELCAICLRAKGLSRELHVDHDHQKGCEHDHRESCPECWRGLLCWSCNHMLAHCRDDVKMLARAIAYLMEPPAQRWRRDGNPG